MRKIAVFLAVCFMLGSVSTVYAVDSVDYKDELTVLKDLLEQCKEEGIPTDYETVNYKTIERFETYINDDIQNYPGSNKDEMISYNIDSMDELYQETKANLEAYLSGEKTAFEVDRPDMMNLTSSGSMLKDGAEPVISIGYGHGTTSKNDVSNFQGFGTNNIQIETGPKLAYSKNDWFYGIANDPVCTYEINKSVYYNGTSSLKVTYSSEFEANHYFIIQQTIPVTPGKTYVLKGMVKGENITRAFMNINTWSPDCLMASGTYDWREYTCEYTVPADTESVVVRVFVDGVVDNIYFDGFTLCEKGTSTNLLYNGSFDNTTTEYHFDPNTSSITSLKKVLKDAQASNVGVSVLLSPHYMLDNMSSEVYNSESEGFLKYNVNHPEARALIKDYLDNLLPILKNYPALTSICITNEPQFNTQNYSSFYTPLFQEYLKEVHGNISTLKSRYGASALLYSDFSKISMPQYLSARNALVYDWMMFNDKMLADWHKWMYDIVKSYLPDVPVHNKMMGLFAGGSNAEESFPAWARRGTDLELLGQASDWAGNDTWDYIEKPQLYYESMFLYDYQMSVLDKPVYNSEDHIIADRNTDFSHKQRVHLRNNLWMGAAHGRSMSTIWGWERSYNESSDNYNSILFRPDAVAEVGKTSLDLIRLNDEMSKIQQAQPKVAIFYSKPSRLYDSYYIKKMFDMYKEILNIGQKVGVVTEASIEKLSEYDVVVMPDVAYGSDTVFAALNAFEGDILYTGKLLAYNEYKNSRDNSELLAKSHSIDNMDVIDYLTNSGVFEVTLIDESTGMVPTEMDWSYVIDGKNILINVSNLNYDNVKNISVYYNGEKCTSITNLITGEKNLDMVSIEGYVPQLLKAYSKELENAEIDSITLDEDSKTISWTYSTKNYTHANIYKITSIGEPSLIGVEKGTSYNYSFPGTYLVRAVSELGEESKGRIITVNEELPFSITIDDMLLKNGHVNGSVTVVNKEATYASGVIVINVVSSTGEVSNYVYDYLTMPPYMKNTIRVSMDASVDAEYVEAYVCTDLSSQTLSSQKISKPL